MNCKQNQHIMNENVKLYQYNEQYDQYDYVEEWLMAIPESEWLYLSMLTDTPNNRPLNEEEMCYLAEIALPMYCQEMKIKEVPYDVAFLTTLISYLLTAIVVLSLKLKGLATTTSPIKLYDNYEIAKTIKMDTFVTDYQ
jgi:hypothetical protein